VICSAIIFDRIAECAMMLQCVIGYSQGVSARLVLARPMRRRGGVDAASLGVVDPKQMRPGGILSARRREERRVELEVRWPDGRRATLDGSDEGVELRAGLSHTAGFWTTTWLWMSPRVGPGQLEITGAWPGRNIGPATVSV
jgi:hypothetical protein